MSDDRPSLRDDRRRYPRKRASWTVTWRERGGTSRLADVLDVSEDGLAFRVRNGRSPEREEMLEVVVTVRDGVALESSVRVANAAGDGRIGAQFVGLPAQDRVILRHYVRYSAQA